MNARTQMIASGRKIVPHPDGPVGRTLTVARRLIPLALQEKPVSYSWVQMGGWGGSGCTKTGIPR